MEVRGRAAVSWNISWDGRVTRLDNGPRRPRWWKNEPKHDNGRNGSGRTILGNAPDPYPGAGAAPAADDGTAAGRR